MKKRELLLCAALGGLFLTSATPVASNDIVRYGSYANARAFGCYMDEFVSHPHGDGNISYKFVFHSYKAGTYRIQVRFNYARKNGTGSRNEQVYLADWSPTAANQTKTVSGTWTLKYDWEKRHTIKCHLFVSSSINTAIRQSQWLIFPATEEETITADEFPWTRPALTGWNAYQVSEDAMLYGGGDWHLHWGRFTIDGKGFEKSYKDPEMGIIPLSKMRFACTGYQRSPANVSWKSGILKIYSYVDDWTIGSKLYDKNAKKNCRSFAVVPKNEGDTTYMELASTYYVRADGREMRSSKPTGLTKRYYETRQLFLPPNPTSAARTYECKLELQGFGEQLSDIFTHSFTVTKTHDAFGPGLSSDFSLTEVL